MPVTKNITGITKITDHDHEFDLGSEFEGGERSSPPPEISDRPLTQNQERTNIVSRIEHHRKHWESCGLPPSPIIMGPDALDSIRPTTDSFPSGKIDEAITNFKAVVSQPDFNPDILPGGHIPNFKNFLIRWVDRFTNEARPLEIYSRKPKAQSPPGKGPDWGGAVDMGKPVKAKSFFDEGDK